MSLTKALRWCGVTRKRWYYKRRRGKPGVNLDVLQLIRQIREERPFYGTRRMAAELSRTAGQAGQPQAGAPGLPADGLEPTAHRIRLRQGPLDANQGSPAQPGLGDGHHLRLVRSRRRLVLLLQRIGHLHQAVDRLPVRHPGHRERRRRVAGRGRRRGQAGLLGG